MWYISDIGIDTTKTIGTLVLLGKNIINFNNGNCLMRNSNLMKNILYGSLHMRHY